MKKKIFAINGSASKNSSNLRLLNRISALAKEDLDIKIYDDLTELPHFNPELSLENTPKTILDIRERISDAQGVIICTPEYVFSIPSGLKNLLEWCVATTIFSRKPIGLITASANGEKGHAELELILKTLDAVFSKETTLLIQGIKGKFNEKGELRDVGTAVELEHFIKSFQALISSTER